MVLSRNLRNYFIHHINRSLYVHNFLPSLSTLRQCDLEIAHENIDDAIFLCMYDEEGELIVKKSFEDIMLASLSYTQNLPILNCFC